MRVLIVSTSEKTGGAALAAGRLMMALNNNGVKAKMLVRDKETESISVAAVTGQRHSLLSQRHFLSERWDIFCHLGFRKNHLFEIDTASSGFDITNTNEYKEADVIHLHWINQGMLSLNTIRRITRSDKAVVWTMHDMWPMTGICHYSRGCRRYRSQCGNCPLLPGNRANDLSTKIWNRKQQIYQDSGIFFVACSRWLEGLAKQSALLRRQRVTNIPNAIDTRLFHHIDQQESRLKTGLPNNKKIILFVSQKVTDKRKGMNFFIDALNLLVKQRPETKDDTVAAILGGHAEEMEHNLPLKAYPLGYISDSRKIIEVYNSADIFVLPSLEDNLPNTIMEAMACGVPAAAFKTGGIPEMIDHTKNGFLAAPRDAASLAEGIGKILFESDRDTLRDACLVKVAHNYSQGSVASKYIEVYNEVLAFKHYKI